MRSALIDPHHCSIFDHHYKIYHIGPSWFDANDALRILSFALLSK
jgi:hypothetical protein